MGYHETPVPQLPVVASTGGKTLSRRLFGYLCVCKLCACVRARELSPQVKVLKGKESLSRGGERGHLDASDQVEFRNRRTRKPGELARDLHIHMCIY